VCASTLFLFLHPHPPPFSSGTNFVLVELVIWP